MSLIRHCAHKGHERISWGSVSSGFFPVPIRLLHSTFAYAPQKADYQKLSCLDLRQLVTTNRTTETINRYPTMNDKKLSAVGSKRRGSGAPPSRSIRPPRHGLGITARLYSARLKVFSPGMGVGASRILRLNRLLSLRLRRDSNHVRKSAICQF